MDTNIIDFQKYLDAADDTTRGKLLHVVTTFQYFMDNRPAPDADLEPYEAQITEFLFNQMKDLVEGS